MIYFCSWGGGNFGKRSESSLIQKKGLVTLHLVTLTLWHNDNIAHKLHTEILLNKALAIKIQKILPSPPKIFKLEELL